MGRPGLQKSAVEDREVGLHGVTVSALAGIDEGDLAALVEQEEDHGSGSQRVAGVSWVSQDGSAFSIS
jgi:hypothetical protein